MGRRCRARLEFDEHLEQLLPHRNRAASNAGRGVDPGRAFFSDGGHQFMLAAGKGVFIKRLPGMNILRLVSGGGGSSL